MKVTKRDGRYESVSFDKVTNRISKQCYDLNIDPISIAQLVNSRIYDKVKTSELDELTAQECISKSTLSLDYCKLASRIIISNNHKNTSPSFSETMYQLYHNIDETTGIKNNLINSNVYEVVMNNKQKLNDIINYDRDYDFDYFSFKTLEKSYLLKSNGKIIERIQHMFLRVSIGLHLNDLKSAIESYNAMSKKEFIMATPCLYNSGTKSNQLASCFLLGTNDSITGIYKTISDCAEISKWAGGIGVHISNIRSNNSIIKGTNGKSTGIIPMLKVYNETAKYVNQGGKRPGSIAIYLEPHHPEILEFLELRKNNGAEHQRARDLFLAVWLSDLFMETMINDGDWYLMDANECPGLDDVYGEEYKELYMKYVKENKYRSSLKARTIYSYITTSQIQTGTPYILFKDNINRKSNQMNVGIIKSSNLCAEITEYSDDKEYSVCTLASIGLPSFVKDKIFDFTRLGEIVKTLVINLNKVIDINYYPVPETRKSNMKHRPMGIGVQGLADVFALLRIPFDSKEANELNINIFETIYYNALEKSCELSKKFGHYETFKGSPLSFGKFQFDLWGVQQSERYDWNSLREDIIQNGVRNSLLIALMPTASTSQILGNNECFEPFTSNIYTRRTTAGDFVVINKHLVKDLTDLNIWNLEIKDEIIKNDGSIQNISNIPDDIKKLYKTVWEIKQKVLIDMSASRAPYVCQTQSLNLFFEEPTFNILMSSSVHAWKKGLKTGSYYIRTRPKARAQQFSLKIKKEDNDLNDNNNLTVNSIDSDINNENKVCDMCSG